MGAFDALWEQAKPAFDQERTWCRARTLALSTLVGLGRRTITGMLTTSAQVKQDWSASYRIFEHGRFDSDALFTPARQGIGERLGPAAPLVVSMDDTLIRKRVRRVHGAAWKRDPLGPPFQTNFVWGQRFLQLSAALPEKTDVCRARSIPIDLVHCPTPKKPKKNASISEWDAHRKLRQAMKMTLVGAERIKHLRLSMDSEPENAGRKLIVAVDGSFSNKEFFRNLPERTTAIGRIRKDARLFLPPKTTDAPSRGRRAFYGAALPTPEQIRQDSNIPWVIVKAWGGGTTHDFEIKTLDNVRWHGTGNKNARLVIIRPLAYRPRKGSRLLYRDPAYLLCTEPELPLETLLQSYLWRWEIEVNFRDEKTLLGMGEAQVHTQSAVEKVPCFVAAAYAYLLLAGTPCLGENIISLPLPKWRKSSPDKRTTTTQMISNLRAQLWGQGMGLNLTHFVNDKSHKPNPPLLENSFSEAVLYAFK